MRILNVRNGNGEDVKDARFVEVLKSAGSRIKSASNEGKKNILYIYYYLPNICLLPITFG